MEEKQIDVNGKTFTIKELKYSELTAFTNLEQAEAAKRIILVSTGMSEEDFENLNIRDGLALQTAINKFNGLDDFQNPPAE